MSSYMRGFGVLILAISQAEAAAAQPADTLVRLAGPPRVVGVAPLVEELSIGVLTGAEEYSFGRVFDITVAEDGTLYVLDRLIPAIRVYNPSGRYLRTIGRGGEGPGEIRAPSGMRLLPGDRLALHDSGNRRITVYSTSGDLVADWPTGPAGGTVGHRRGFAVDTAGFVYALRSVIERVPAESAGAAIRMEATSIWVRMRADDGAVVDTLRPPAFPPFPAPFRAENDRGWRQMAMPFTPRRLWAISPLGYGVSGVPNRYAFELLLPDGPAVSVRRDVALEPVSAREREKTRDRIQARMREVNPTWGWGGRDIPSVKPAYIELDVGLDGRIWLTIEQSVPPPVRPPPSAARGSGASGGGVLAPPTAPDDFVYEPTLFHVFEPDGRFVGAVAAPPRVTLMAMRGDYVWGVALGEYDIELVKRYRIVWPGG